LNIFAEDVKGQVRNYQEARHIAVSYLLIWRDLRINTSQRRWTKSASTQMTPSTWYAWQSTRSFQVFVLVLKGSGAKETPT
jgi:hypothetical protein